MGEKLNKKDFNNRYRYRDSRNSIDAARCQLCRHCVGEHCVHPERKRRIFLSEYWGSFSGAGTHRDIRNDRVCDQVEIAVPGSIIFPDLPAGYAIKNWSVGARERNELLHGDPRCPYIAARVVDGGLTEFPNEGIEIRDISLWATVAPYCLCELAECAHKLGLPPGQRDYYLTHQGFDDGYVYVPPPPKLLDYSGIDAPIESRSLQSTLYNFGIGVNAAEQDILDMIRLVKRLAQELGLPHTPHEEKPHEYYHMSWDQLFMTLRLFGWREVADRLAFEIAVKIEERLYCISCALQRNEYGQQENPVRHGSDPHCPVCGRVLVCHLTFSNSMSE